MRFIGFLILAFVSVSAQAELRCPAKSHRRVECGLKPRMAGSSGAGVSQVIVCQLDTNNALLIFPDSLTTVDMVPAHFYRTDNGYERIVGGPTPFGGPIEISTPQVVNGRKIGPLPSTVILGRQPYSANCTMDKTPQSFNQVVSEYLPLK